ncbi:trypsin-like peptidase domain-containing protein [Bradyrhizobium genosp. L]|nr:trypsin-like peptidase domain-containing protein [Bradyrhizobium genosp. L]
MLIKPTLIAASEQRLKQADISPTALDKKLGDGPLKLSPEKKQMRQRQLLQQTDDVQAVQIGLERIIEGNDLDSINYLAKGMLASRSVCRIQLKDARANLIGYASGFLIGPGLLMTNHHVFGGPGDAATSIADFDYELDVAGMERPAVRFGFEPGRFFYTNIKLDYSIVAVGPKSLTGDRDLTEWGWLPLSGEPGKGDPGEYLTIVQHPGGELKQVCVRENKLLQYVGDYVWYKTDTTGGSSGSPAFNRFWQVIALHHSGVPKKDSAGHILTTEGKVWDTSMDETSIDWVANEGVRVSSIVADLKVAVGSNPLIKPVLDQQAPPPPPPPAPSPGRETLGLLAPVYGSNVWLEQTDDATTLVVPIRVPMPVIKRQAPPSAPPSPATMPAIIPAGPQVGIGRDRHGHGDGGGPYRPDHARLAPRLQAQFHRQWQAVGSAAEAAGRTQVEGGDAEGRAVRVEVLQLQRGDEQGAQARLLQLRQYRRRQAAGCRQARRRFVAARSAHRRRIPGRRRVLQEAIDLRSRPQRQSVRSRPFGSPPRRHLGRYG